MKNNKLLLEQALQAATEVRHNANRDLMLPLCIFDLASEMGLEVRFLSLPSLEGMYSAGPTPTIIIGAQRPSGRRAYTCAHELGHHIFGHGTRIDLLRKAGESKEFIKEEFLAQAFAGFLLMPKLGLLRAFKDRGLRPDTAKPIDFFRVARFFGVGYSTLVHHLCAIAVINDTRKATLLKTKPFQICQQLLPDVVATNILPIDNGWMGRAIDAEVGEVILATPSISLEGDNLVLMQHPSSNLYKATKPGCCRLVDKSSTWAAFVRVSRYEYEGRCLWRHLPEEDNE